MACGFLRSSIDLRITADVFFSLLAGGNLSTNDTNAKILRPIGSLTFITHPCIRALAHGS